jgi:hypothetical protein
MTIYMETTKVPPERSASEITSLLVRAGARQLLMEYDKAGKLTGLKFMLEIRGRPVPFALPARTDAVFKYLQTQRKRGRGGKEDQDREQSERIAWRQLLRWVQAQIAMIEIGMVEAGEVFLPYVEVEPGVTAWQRAISGGQLALPPGPEGRENNVAEFKR